MIRVGWREYLKQRFTKPSRYFSIGIAFNKNDIRVSVFEKQQGNLVWVKQQDFPIEGWQIALKDYVSRHNLAATPCYITFGTDKYQLLQVDRPKVAEDEICQALSWSVKDLVPIQEELIVDYFDLPAQSAGADKIHVVAMARAEVEALCMDIRQSGLDLQAVGIAELALCDLLQEKDEAVMTLLQRPGQEICLSIFKGGQLYFSRRLRGYENLSTFTKQELEMGVGDNLSVEIQRSLDYFESQLRQAPVKKIYLAIETPIVSELAGILQKLVFMPVEPMLPDVQGSDKFDVYKSSYSSLGAALSRDLQTGNNA